VERLVVKNLYFSFGFKDILEDINFVLEKGKVTSIVGPSGGGKTTLLHLCSNLLKLENGKIENSFKSSAFAFQEPRLLPWKNVIDNIALGLLAKKCKKDTAIKKAKEIAFKFGLTQDDFMKFPKDLSGGMKQRVSFARALVVNPSLLFLDEPFSALDIGLKKELQSILIESINKQNMSVLFITHDLMEAIKLSDEIIVLKAQPVGHIVKKFNTKLEKNKRDDDFVHNEMAKFLKDKIIIDSFELELK